MKKQFLSLLLVGVAGCGSTPKDLPADLVNASATQVVIKQAHAETIKANKANTRRLDFSDRRDYERVNKGFIASFDQGIPQYDPTAYDFLSGDAPNTVNPSLWRQSQLLAKHGLFKVTDGIYQVRSFDLSNITFIEGDSGWIVVDPLITKEAAARAKALVDRELGKKPISAIIITHSHIDHYGGIRGLVNKDEVEIITPTGFVLETVSENVLAGNAMGRRATYMFGPLLPKGPEAQVGVGLGQAISNGTPGMLFPTREVAESFERFNVDGVDIEFMLTLGAEAPAEFMFYLPKKRAFCQAEIINHTLHNLLTPRGAKVRDGRLWSRYIDQAIATYADKTDVSFGSHHWPVWGQQDVRELWEGQRNLYRYIHDQTVRLANEGYTLHEIPSQLRLPESIAREFANRDYYGTVSHNSKAQYQLYFGYFDGNPANLNALPPEEEGRKFVAYVGGAEAVLGKALADYEAGEFRFAATALSHLVFAEPENSAAKTLLANTYRQLAYQAESGSWRNFYLTAAQELSVGILELQSPLTNGLDVVKAIPLELYFDLLAVRLNGPKAAGKNLAINFELTDTGESAFLFLSGGALHHRLGVTREGVPTLRMTRPALDSINSKTRTISELRKSGDLVIEGSALKVKALFDLIEEPEYWFNIVTP